MLRRFIIKFAHSLSKKYYSVRMLWGCFGVEIVEWVCCSFKNSSTCGWMRTTFIPFLFWRWGEGGFLQLLQIFQTPRAHAVSKKYMFKFLKVLMKCRLMANFVCIYELSAIQSWEIVHSSFHNCGSEGHAYNLWVSCLW